MKLLFLCSLFLLSISLLLAPLSAEAAGPCIAREYPQLDEAGNTILVTEACDGSYAWEMVTQAGPAPSAPALSAPPPPAPPATAPTNGATVGTKARVVAPPPR